MSIASVLTSPPVSRAACEQWDLTDPLAGLRARFQIPDGTIYLDGNSLGALPASTPALLAGAISQEWGRDLIRSWNSADWARLPYAVGRQLAPLLGARPDEVIVTDSTSVNIFKLLCAILGQPTIRDDPRRRYILSDSHNFPTDLYIAEGVVELFGGRYQLKLVDQAELFTALDSTVAAALITHVDYRTGAMHPMAEFNDRAAASGACILWDLSHSAGALELDLNAAGCDFAVGCGYKYLNGGPGAPAYLYVRQELQRSLANPISGWFGHAAPFAFTTAYQPAGDLSRFLSGTPSVLATIALAEGIRTFEGVAMADVRKKSLALSDLFWQLMSTMCGDMGFSCISPSSHQHRASHLSFAHEHAYEIMQAIISRGVIGDFRQPNLMRFGFTPLYTRFVDCWDAVATIRDVVEYETWRDARFQTRHLVT
jgi:kynureninase